MHEKAVFEAKEIFMGKSGRRSLKGVQGVKGGRVEEQRDNKRRLLGQERGERGEIIRKRIRKIWSKKESQVGQERKKEEKKYKKNNKKKGNFGHNLKGKRKSKLAKEKEEKNRKKKEKKEKEWRPSKGKEV